MKITVYQYTEPPLVLEEADMMVKDGEVVIVNSEGRLTFGEDDIMKIEVEKDTQ